MINCSFLSWIVQFGLVQGVEIVIFWWTNFLSGYPRDVTKMPRGVPALPSEDCTGFLS